MNTYYVNSVQFRDGTMTGEQAVALGAASADGIPVPSTSSAPPLLAYTRDGAKFTLSWDPSITGFSLEGTDGLSSPTWSAVPDVVNNSVIITIGAGHKFFRLKKP